MKWRELGVVVAVPFTLALVAQLIWPVDSWTTVFWVRSFIIAAVGIAAGEVYAYRVRAREERERGGAK